MEDPDTIFDQWQENCKQQKENAYKETVKMETQVLYHRVLFELYQQRTTSYQQNACVATETSDGMAMMKRHLVSHIIPNHQCSAKVCDYLSYKKGQTFSVWVGTERKVYCATGVVYICKQTALAHVCDQNCQQYVEMTKDACLVCRISGLIIDRVMVLSERGKKRITSVSAETAQIPDNIPNKSYQLHPDERLIRKMKVQRKNNKQIARHICQQMLYTEYNERLAVQRSKKIELEADQVISHYYQMCARQGKCVDVLTVIRLYTNTVKQCYMKLPPIDNTVERNKKNIPYYISCMLEIYEMLKGYEGIVPSSVGFRQLAVGILSTLPDGFCPTLYILKNGKVVRECDRPRDKRLSRPVCIEFIPSHPEIRLARLEDLRREREKVNGVGSNKRKRGIDNTLRAYSNNVYKSRNRQKKNLPSTIDTVKILKQCYDDLIRKSGGLDDLKKLKLRNRRKHESWI